MRRGSFGHERRHQSPDWGGEARQAGNARAQVTTRCTRRQAQIAPRRRRERRSRAPAKSSLLTDQVLADGRRLCKGTALLRELTPRTLDAISGLGERLSAPLVCRRAVKNWACPAKPSRPPN